jgi:hypothetical protein
MAMAIDGLRRQLQFRRAHIEMRTGAHDGLVFGVVHRFLSPGKLTEGTTPGTLPSLEEEEASAWRRFKASKAKGPVSRPGL